MSACKRNHCRVVSLATCLRTKATPISALQFCSAMRQTLCLHKSSRLLNLQIQISKRSKVPLDAPRKLAGLGIRTTLGMCLNRATTYLPRRPILTEGTSPRRIVPGSLTRAKKGVKGWTVV